MTRRKFASQVHQQASRLLKGNYMKKEPVWFRAVLDHPPISLPAKQTPSRPEVDLKPNSKPKHYNVRPAPVYYLEDDIRRQFFQDHPFETFRPTSLVEDDVISPPSAVQGVQWTRLRQRGRNPTAEDVVQFTVNLHQAHNVSLSDAYASAVAQFHALRSEHHVATTIAVMEAESLGSVFGPSEVEQQFEKEKEYLETWGNKKKEEDQGALEARKRWKAIVDRKQGNDQWTKGQEYVRLWREGVRPNYNPALTTPVARS